MMIVNLKTIILDVNKYFWEFWGNLNVDGRFPFLDSLAEIDETV
jgi:hypothetical protein